MVRSRKGPAMNDYMITTDNNADLPEDFYKNHEVGCTYLSYTLEGKEYTEGNFLPVEEFYNKMRAGSMPTIQRVPEHFLSRILKTGEIFCTLRFLRVLAVRSTAAGSRQKN